MTIDTELVAIGIALLAIILWTWVSLRRIEKKLDMLLLSTHTNKKKEDSNHSDSTQTNN